MHKSLLCALFSACLLSATASAASTPEFVNNTLFKDGKMVMQTSETGCFRHAPALQPRADEGEEIWVYATLDYDTDEYEVNPYPLVYKPGEEGNFGFGMYDYMSGIDFYLPAGQYDVLFEFKRTSDRMIYYVFRHIEVTEDMLDDGMEFSVSPLEADQLIEFNPIDPEGKALSSDVIRLTDGEQDGIYSEGYLNIADQLFLVCSKQYGELMSYTVLRWSLFYDPEKEEYRTDCINKVYATESDDLFFCSGFGGVTSDASLSCLLVSDGARTQTVTNTTDFKTFEQNILNSPYVPVADDKGQVFPKGHSCVNTYYICRDGAMTGYRNRTVVGGSKYDQKQIIAWQGPADRRNGMSLMPVPTVYEGLESSGYIEGLPLYLDGDENTYMAGIMTSGRFRYNSDGSNKIVDFANPWRSIPAAENPVWGYGFPTIRTYRNAGNAIHWAVAGALGESRLIDDAILIKTLDGEDFSDEDLPLTAGEDVKLTLTDNNFELAGVRGIATLETGLTVEDESSVAPTIQSFRVIKKNGEVATELENAVDGIAEVYGGLFSVAPIDAFTSYYECEAPTEVVIEYAPNGTTEWTALEVRPNEEYDFMPGWGHYYSASLEGVTTPSENHLYDLRLTLKGAAGQYAVQTVSPAFSLVKNDAIDAINADSEVLATTYNDLGGRVVVNPAEGGVYIRTDVMTDGSRRVAKIVK